MSYGLTRRYEHHGQVDNRYDTCHVTTKQYLGEESDHED